MLWRQKKGIYIKIKTLMSIEIEGKAAEKS